MTGNIDMTPINIKSSCVKSQIAAGEMWCLVFPLRKWECSSQDDEGGRCSQECAQGSFIRRE